MKKIFLVCAIVVGFSAASFAQGGGRMSAEERVAGLKTSLTLNDAQVAKVKAIYDGQAKTMDSLRTVMQAGGDMAAMRPAFTKMTEATNAKIKAVLTPEQTTAFQKQIDAQAEAMRARMGN